MCEVRVFGKEGTYSIFYVLCSFENLMISCSHVESARSAMVPTSVSATPGCQAHTNGGCSDLCVSDACMWHCECYNSGRALQDNCYTCLGWYIHTQPSIAVHESLTQNFCICPLHTGNTCGSSFGEKSIFSFSVFFFWLTPQVRCPNNSPSFHLCFLLHVADVDECNTTQPCMNCVNQPDTYACINFCPEGLLWDEAQAMCIGKIISRDQALVRVLQNLQF